jgi:hypothetical protein
MTRRELLAMSPGLLLLNCSGNTTPKTPEKAPEPVTGLHALYQMHTFASTWAQDLKVVRLSSLKVPEVKAVPGKAAAWQAQFSSVALGKVRGYTFSVYDESATVRLGIFADTGMGPLYATTRSFEIGAATADSDKAWDLSVSHAQKYSAEHPDTPVFWILEGDPKTDVPVWRIIWGARAATSEFSILVDAHAGTYMQTVT